MRRAVLLAAVIALTGCSGELTPWDGQGIVTAKRYDDPDSWTTTQCHRVGKQACGMTTYHQHHDPAHWTVQVTSEDGDEHIVEVTEETFKRCRKAATWSVDHCVG